MVRPTIHSEVGGARWTASAALFSGPRPRCRSGTPAGPDVEEVLALGEAVSLSRLLQTNGANLDLHKVCLRDIMPKFNHTLFLRLFHES